MNVFENSDYYCLQRIKNLSRNAPTREIVTRVELKIKIVFVINIFIQIGLF